MNRALYNQLLQRLDRSMVSLILAASQGAAQLEMVLSGESPAGRGEDCPAPSGPAVFLKSLGAGGFRGVGPFRSLELQPRPGLTLVMGPNGSGKSSLAEGLEVLLTGNSSRWADRSMVWRLGWQNLHAASESKVRAEFVGGGETLVLERTWPRGARVDSGRATPLPPGWETALNHFRPFLAHSELSSLVQREPTRLHDGLATVLGLDDLDRAAGVLRQARLRREQVVKRVAEERSALGQRLETLPDERAQLCHRALLGENWNLDLIESQLETPAGWQQLHALAALRIPELGPLLRGRALDVRAEAALRLLELAPTEDCPLCHGPLNCQELKRELTEQARLVREVRALCPPPPEVLRGQVSGFDLEPVLQEWRAWHSLPADLESRTKALARRVQAVAEQARLELQRLGADWQPIASDLRLWTARARESEAQAAALGRLRLAELQLKRIARELRSERLLPIADTALDIYRQLRPECSVALERVSLEGAANSRHVALDVRVDSARATALGVMSQGELNALALSIFLPRAMHPDSPFRFLVIDDPVQAMDPTMVDGLARLLQWIARTWQVVVLTHDQRLSDSLRKLGVVTDIVNVRRLPGSLVELRR